MLIDVRHYATSWKQHSVQTCRSGRVWRCQLTHTLDLRMSQTPFAHSCCSENALPLHRCIPQSFCRCCLMHRFHHLNGSSSRLLCQLVSKGTLSAEPADPSVDIARWARSTKEISVTDSPLHHNSVSITALSLCDPKANPACYIEGRECTSSRPWPFAIDANDIHGSSAHSLQGARLPRSPHGAIFMLAFLTKSLLYQFSIVKRV